MPDTPLNDNDLFNPSTDLTAPEPAPVAQPAHAAPAAGNSGMAINNPLNLRPLPGGMWGGQSGTSPAGFATFDDPASGWNAAETNLQAKVTKHGLKTLSGIIGDPTYGWAPAADNNDPASYAAKVAAALGVNPTDDISQKLLTDPTFRRRALEAMAGIETGAPQTFGGSDAGLSAQEQSAWDALTGPAPTTTAGQTKGSAAQFNFGPGFKPMTAAAVTAFQKIDKERGIDPKADEGSPNLPYYVTPGTPVPRAPGIHWVDADGTEHVNPGGALERGESIASGALQGLVMDTGASLSRLTNGAAGMAGLSPEQQGQFLTQNPGVDPAAATRQAVTDQQRQYAVEHLGDPYAQAGRFGGQTVPATLAAGLVPEAEAPAALGAFGRAAAPIATRALQGVAATAPGVGANATPVGEQLATGALAGVVAPEILKAPAAAARAVTGLGRTVSPDVAALAEAAQTKYGIPLRSGQVMGANGDRKAATADSNLLGSSPKMRANNETQRQAWMRGVTNTYGDASGDVSAGALQDARDRIGGVMNDVASRNNIAPQAADGLQTRISQIVGDGQDVLGDDAKPLLTMAEKIGSVRGPEGISGQSYQALTNKGAALDRLAQSDNSNVAHYAGQMRDALDDAMQASASDADTQAFRDARFQYKNLMTVAKLAPRADVHGIISPALLRGAVGSNFKNQAFRGAGDLGELAQIGQTFMKEPPQSGTAPRLADMLGPLGVGAGLGGLTELGGALAHNPEHGIGALASLAATIGGKTAASALKENRIGGSAAGIVARSIPGSPGSVRSALSGLRNLTRPVEVPLSALAGVRGLQSFAPSPAIATP